MPGVQFFSTYYDGQTDLAQLKRASNFLSHFPALLVFDTYILRQDSRQYVVYSGPTPGTEIETRRQSSIRVSRLPEALTGRLKVFNRVMCAKLTMVWG